MLLNSRRSDSKDEKPNQAGLEMRGGGGGRKQFMFIGYSVLGREPAGLFQQLRVYKSPPYTKNIAETDQETGKIVTDLRKVPKEDGQINESFNMR